MTAVDLFRDGDWILRERTAAVGYPHRRIEYPFTTRDCRERPILAQSTRVRVAALPPCLVDSSVIETKAKPTEARAQ